MFSKARRVKLNAEELRQLNEAIFERDGYTCVCCGAYVASDHKFHHEPCGINKSDEMDKGAVLCMQCHFLRHNSGEHTKRVRAAVLKHLERIKGE